jgi:formylglycine-generating enzyme required for sulfatase activity
MKYEITQGQYADFLNVLTRDQQATRCQASTTLGGYMYSVWTLAVQRRNTVQLTTDPGSPAPRGYTTVTRDRACNWVSWADGCAFTDWAGLRPMTELEFEKACRGPLDPVAGEYAWGNTNISATPAILYDGSGMETAINGNCNYDKCYPDGPYRVGFYMKKGSTRQEAGASYWGIMELSGNLLERPVTVGNATGRLFTGLHGDGMLTSGGEADFTALKWPDATANGAGCRGGGCELPSACARVSDRSNAAYAVGTSRSHADYFGWRAVRSAPSGVGP